MELLALPAYTDNYIWMLHNGQDALVVDPGEASVVIQALQQRELNLVTILVTHRHADHIAGLDALRPHLNGPIYAPTSLARDLSATAVTEGDSLAFGEAVFEVLETPGHTREHISFWCRNLSLENQTESVLFCGDTLFSAGCGRVFDGEPESLYFSLNRLAHLPEQTKICPAHEYTLSNLAFSRAAEPDNPLREDYFAHCTNLRGRLMPTLPTTLSVERQINPFLRLTEKQIKQAALQHEAASESALDVFLALRSWKNTF